MKKLAFALLAQAQAAGALIVPKDPNSHRGKELATSKNIIFMNHPFVFSNEYRISMWHT